MTDFDFISATDHPALLAISDPNIRETARSALASLGYKIHAIDVHEEFTGRFAEVQYEVFIVDENFGGQEENITLAIVQNMPMSERRHAVVVLLGASFETFNAMQAFQQSVHAVVNYSELSLLPQLVQKVVAENNTFLFTYRETVKRLFQGASAAKK